MHLPGVAVLATAGITIQLRNRKIPHNAILQALRTGADGSRSITEVYRQEVLPIKTRTIPLLGKKSPATITNTLLGCEVQASYKRIHCPDMVTARYLKLFTELGCRRIRLPYDPTVTERLLPELDSAQKRVLGGIQELFPGNRRIQVYVLRRIYSLIRAQLRSE